MTPQETQYAGKNHRVKVFGKEIFNTKETGKKSERKQKRKVKEKRK